MNFAFLFQLCSAQPKNFLSACTLRLTLAARSFSDQLISLALRRADNKGKAERLRTVPDLDWAALRLRDAMRFVLDPKRPELARRDLLGRIVR